MWNTFLLCEPLHDEGSLAAKPILWCCQQAVQSRWSLTCHFPSKHLHSHVEQLSN